MQLKEAIAEILAQRGTDILKDAYRFHALLRDFAPECSQERTVFKHAVDDKVLSYFLCEDTSKRTIHLIRAKMELADKGLAPSWIDVILSSIAEPLGWQQNLSMLSAAKSATESQPVVTAETTAVSKSTATSKPTVTSKSKIQNISNLVNSKPLSSSTQTKKLVSEEELKACIQQGNVRQMLDTLTHYPDLNKRITEIVPEKNGWSHTEIEYSLLSYIICKAPHALSVIEWMLEHGADANGYRLCTNKHGTEKYPLLWYAIDQKDTELVKLLLKHGANPSLYFTGYDGAGEPRETSLLSHAIHDAKNIEMVQLFLEYGTDANSYRQYMYEHSTIRVSALHDAIFSLGNYEMVRLLLERGADTNNCQSCICKGVEMFSAMFYAISDKNDSELVKLLLEYGANPSVAYTYNGMVKGNPLLAFAINAKNLEIVRLLLKHGADANSHRLHLFRNMRLLMGETAPALHDAIAFAHDSEMVKLLLQYGASWDKEVTFRKKSYPLKRFPYQKILSSTEFAQVKEVLKESGWKGAWF